MIPIMKTTLGEEEAQAAREVILSGWVTQGPRVKEFEKNFAEYVGADYACAVSSCTTALHLALLTVGVKPGDVVITVSHSFIATANAIRYCGAEPVFVDIDPNTYNLDIKVLQNLLSEHCKKKDNFLFYNKIEKIAVGESPLRNFNKEITSLGRVAAILPVHQIGIPCDITNIVNIAKEFNLPVVEDAACAIGSEISFNQGNTWEKIGKPHGDIACFSFHPRKILTTGDGGMITTNNKEFDTKHKLLRQHAMSIPDTVRHKTNDVLFEEYISTAFNYRMTDIQAAIGIKQLEKIDFIVAERQLIADKYEKLLTDIPYISLIKINKNIHSNWQSYPIKIQKNSNVSQFELMQYLLDNKIACRRGIMNAHQEKAYNSVNWLLPKSEFCRDNTILLPLYSGIPETNIEFISDRLKKYSF